MTLEEAARVIGPKPYETNLPRTWGLEGLGGNPPTPKDPQKPPRKRKRSAQGTLTEGKGQTWVGCGLGQSSFQGLCFVLIAGTQGARRSERSEDEHLAGEGKRAIRDSQGRAKQGQLCSEPTLKSKTPFSKYSEAACATLAQMHCRLPASKSQPDLAHQTFERKFATQMRKKVSEQGGLSNPMLPWTQASASEKQKFSKVDSKNPIYSKLDSSIKICAIKQSVYNIGQNCTR